MQHKWLIFGGGALLGAYLIFGNSAETALGAAMGDDSFTRYDHLFRRYARQFSVPWRWLKAIAITESNLGRAKSVQRGLISPGDEEGSKSFDGLSWGIMQVTKATAKGLTGRVVSSAELNSPEFSVELAARLLAELIGRFGLDAEKVFRAYNGGPRYGAATLPYWAKSKINIAIVMKAHPGDELEH